MYKFDEKYFLEQFCKLLSIDSTTGQFREIQNFIIKEIEEMGYPVQKRKNIFLHVREDRSWI